MLEELKKQVYEANMMLPNYGLVTFTWGNVSGIDRASGLFVIKPSGVEYDLLTPEDMVVVDLQGNKVEGRYNPSSDTATHVVLYNRFPEIGGIVHTHSSWATSWAQAGRDIPCYGTTHADYIYGEVPCVRNLTQKEIDEAYEYNTGVLIADEFERRGKDYTAVPAVLCKNHGPFTWGKDAHEAVHNAVVLEEVAKMAARCEMINPQNQPAPQELQHSIQIGIIQIVLLHMNPFDPELTVSPSCLARFHCIKKFCCFSALFQHFIKNSCSFFSFSFISHTINLPPIIMLLYSFSSFKNALGIPVGHHL